MIKAKSFLAAALAAATIGTTSATASAAVITMPLNWTAVYAPGAPGDVNKIRSYEIYAYGGGYDVACTGFAGDYDRALDVSIKYDTYYQSGKTEKVATLHATTSSPILIKNPANIYGNTIIFSFKAYGENGGSCTANGVLSYHT